EGHMLQKMRDAVLLYPLMPPASGDPDPDACRLKAGHRLGHNAKSVGQRGQAAGQLAILSRIWARRVARSLGRRVTRSARSNRTAIRGSGGARTPIDASTASGNFAGCAVASVIIGVAPK